MRRFQLLAITDEPTADKILGMMNGDLDPCEVSDRCDAWVRSCYNEPSDDEQTLHAADDLLGNYGVEGWCDQDDFSRPGVSYSNTGDSYARTIFLRDGVFILSTFEGMATRYPRG